MYCTLCKQYIMCSQCILSSNTQCAIAKRNVLTMHIRKQYTRCWQCIIVNNDKCSQCTRENITRVSNTQRIKRYVMCWQCTFRTIRNVPTMHISIHYTICWRCTRVNEHICNNCMVRCQCQRVNIRNECLTMHLRKQNAMCWHRTFVNNISNAVLHICKHYIMC